MDDLIERNMLSNFDIHKEMRNTLQLLLLADNKKLPKIHYIYICNLLMITVLITDKKYL